LLFKKPTAICGHCQKEKTYTGKSLRYIQPHEIFLCLQTFFQSRGYISKTVPNVKNQYQDTVFIVAALQVFNAYLIAGERPYYGNIFSPQPCVRLKASANTEEDCISTSFVNVATLKLDATFDEYLRFLEDWIEALSSVGFYVPDLMIVISSQPAGNQHRYFGWGVDILYCGLELGFCSYLNRIISDNGEEYTGIDCGFAIERICKSLGNLPYFLPLVRLEDAAIGYNFREQDLLRTGVLLAMSKIVPGARGENFQMRKIIRAYCSNYRGPGIEESIRHYYWYWSTFLDEYELLDQCIFIISKEISYHSLKNAGYSEKNRLTQAQLKNLVLEKYRKNLMR
jgi:hypothetical protein